MPELPCPRLVLEVGSEEELLRLHERDLRKGRAFVPGFLPLAARAPCTLAISLRSGGAEIELTAEAVFAQPDGPHAGIGVELVPFDERVQKAIKAFVEERPRASGGNAAEVAPLKPESDGTELDDAGAEETDGGEPGDTAPNPGSAEATRQRSLYDRIRALSSRERDVMARTGSLPERVALERCYGTSVWEGLLQNPQLSQPEVARIAKNGSVPQPLLGAIVSNSGWLSSPEVQRALLGNPRVVGAHLERVLRALSRHDLALVEKSTAYRMAVRTLAKRLRSP